MNMRDLIKYDLPGAVIDLWEREESQSLLPLQESVVKRHGLFGDENLLVQAPTSSGKTFIGEMAAIQTALRRKKVVYLVPLKALAEEKYRDFRGKYEAYGLHVIISTRDHRQFDADFENGNFSIAVAVYEKLAQLLVRRPERLKEIDLVIADELEILSDPERGGAAELLLTRLLQAKRRLIGLSAVIGQADRLAIWMNAALVSYERRPVELRYGVLHEGIFRYKTYNEATEGAEELVDGGGESPWETLTRNVCHLAGCGEPCLIFVKAKFESRRGAELLSGRVQLPAASGAIERLRQLEATRARDTLISTMENGVAFHNADLSPSERQLVEEAYRRGEVKVLVSTSTLAVGLNLPAQNVFISGEKWRYDQRLDIPWKTPIQHTEYENMGGRAGRYGAGHAFGRSILIATTPFDAETYWRRYIEGEREGIDPRLAREPLENHVLRLVASRSCTNVEELVEFLEGTLSGRWVWLENYTVDEVGFRIRSAVTRCAEAGMIEQGDGELRATPLGQAVAAKGLSIQTARDLELWIAQSGARAWIPLDFFFAAASTADGRMLQVMLSAQEYERADYAARIRRITRAEPMEPQVPLNRLRANSLLPPFEEMRAIKIALFLNEWIEHAAVRDIEETYNTMAGQLLSAADQMAWLCDATAALARAHGGEQPFVETLDTLTARLQHGVREEEVALARAGIPGLSRAGIAALLARNWDTRAAIAALPLASIEAILPGEAARALKHWAEGPEEEKPMKSTLSQPAPTAKPHELAPGPPAAPGASPVLVIDDRQPGQVLLEGKRVGLQEKQFRLIRCLAEAPGECIPYELIYEQLWGDVVVEDNQMHFQKRKLLKAFSIACPQHARLVTAIPKRGFRLELEPEQVLVHARISAAA